MRPGIRLRLHLTLFISTCSIFVGCLNGSSEQNARLEPGSKPFQFDLKKVQTLTLAKSDPLTGDHWFAVLQPKPVRPRRRTAPAPWEITSAPGDFLLADRNADEIFLSHLLDSLTALKVESAAPRGGLESFGLNPPRFAIQWKVPNRVHELRLGDSLKIPGQSYMTLDGHNVYVASGSAIRLLSMIDSFDSLRKKDWSDLSADDVDEVSVYRSKKAVFYAQREGERWTDRRHRPVRVATRMSSTLEELVRFRPERLIDEEAEVTRLSHRLRTVGDLETRLTDRLGHTTSLVLGWEAGKLYGVSSARPKVIFAWNADLERKIRGGLLE